jgi:hypothetical protein
MGKIQNEKLENQSKKIVTFTKQVLRSKVSRSASYVEIYLSIIILIGILLLSITEIIKIVEITKAFIYGGEMISINEFLGIAFELIIGVEFVKMLAKHTPGSTVEVLLFAIARQLITTHESMLDSLFGVIAIAVLFAVRKYLSESVFKSHEDEYVVNGGISIRDLNAQLDTTISTEYGNTVAGVIYNIAQKNGDPLKAGYTVALDDLLLQVYSMDADLIKQVKISDNTKNA